MFFHAYNEEKKEKDRLRAGFYKIAVIGGDKRQVYLAQILAARGYDVAACGLCENVHGERIRETTALSEALEQADAVVCPVPFLRSGKITGSYEAVDMNTETLFGKMPGPTEIFAGNIPDNIRGYAEKQGHKVYDMMQEEQVASMNAVATAEGAVAEAITRSPVNLTKSRCLILGYGRCGSALTRLLKAFFCQVFVLEKDRMKAANASVLADGIVSLEELADAMESVDFIFNTAPEMILTEERLRHVGKKAWILDIASAPGGVDYRAAETLAVNAVLLPGLPGRYSPWSSAEILADFIEKRLGLH